MQQEIIRMSKRELKRVKVIHKVMEKKIKKKDAAAILSLSSVKVK